MDVCSLGMEQLNLWSLYQEKRNINWLENVQFVPPIIYLHGWANFKTLHVDENSEWMEYEMIFIFCNELYLC